MRHKLVVPTILLIISTMLTGCIFKPEEKLLPEGYDRENVTIKYIENRDPILTIQNFSDFSDFKLVDHAYFAASNNLSLTLDSESSHGTYIVNASDKIPEGYRIYGASEAYNLNKRYILLQYKVFDNNEKLNDSMNMTVYNYINNGFRSKPLNGVDYKGRILILESNITNRTDINITNNTDMNIIIILFGYDTVIGKIGVQDYRNKSLDESLKILDIVSGKLKINTRQVTVAKVNIFGTHGNDATKKE